MGYHLKKSQLNTNKKVPLYWGGGTYIYCPENNVIIELHGRNNKEKS